MYRCRAGRFPIQYITVLNTRRFTVPVRVYVEAGDVVKDTPPTTATWRENVERLCARSCSQQQGVQAHMLPRHGPAHHLIHFLLERGPRPHDHDIRDICCRTFAPFEADRASDSPTTTRETTRTRNKAKLSFRAWEARKRRKLLRKTETPRSRKYRVKAATCCSPTGASAKLPKTLARGHARENITIKFVGQENKSGPLDDSSDLRTRKKKHLTAAQRKLRELQSMEWHLRKI